jgi:hypothetical protein
MGSINSRLARLEEQGGGSVCPECGLGETEGRPYVLIDEEDPERSFKGDPCEVCARCGQRLHAVIEVVRGDPRHYEEGEGR